MNKIPRFVQLTASCATLVFLLIGCGERPQTARPPAHAQAPYKGTSSHFVAPGWEQGNKASWESQLRSRMQNTQNEYSKVH